MKLLSCMALALGLSFTVGGLHASEPAMPAVESFFSHPEVLNAQLSPSGRYLAITTSKGLVRVGLFVFDLQKPGKPHTAGYFPDIDVLGFDWVNDTHLVFRVGDLKQGVGRNEGKGSGLYATNVDGSDLRQLIRRRAEASEGSSRMLDRVLRANHALLDVLPPDPAKPREDVLVGEYQGNEKGELVRVVPHWLNIKTGLKRRVETPIPEGAQSWLFDSEGQPRVTIALQDTSRVIYWRGDGEEGWRRIGQGDLIDLPFNPVAVDSQGTLYVSRPEGAAGTAVLARFDHAKRQPEREALVRAPGFDVGTSFISAAGQKGFLGIRITTDAESTIWWDPTMKKLQADVDAKLPGRINHLSCRRCGESDMVVLAYSYSDRDPGQYLVYTATDGSWRSVARTMPAIDPSTQARVDFQRFKARDGREIPVWLTLPKGHKAGEPAPAVVLVHGGPWVRGGAWQWEAMSQFLASRGYLVISPEFRGSTGYGSAHFRAGWKKWGTAMQDDVADALLWAQEQKLTDERACVAGASYGGYSTLMSLVRHPKLYRCGVAWVAVTDPFLLLKRSSIIEDDTSELTRQHSLPTMIGDPEADAEMLTLASPLAQAERLKTPVLMAFGESDVRVPLAHGTRMREALTKAGNVPQWVTYPTEGHSWILPATNVDFAKRVEAFLAQHLGPAKR